MDKIVKKSLEFGLGVGYITVEALEQAMDRLAKEGKISKKDGEKMVRELASKYEIAGKKYSREVQARLDRFVNQAPFATKKDIADLNAKINRMGKASKKRKR
jgi:polyhydroxyalkanoate synthesis regulator phasin